MQLQFQYRDEQITLHVEPEGDGWRVRLPDGTTHRIQVARRPDDVLRITADLADGAMQRAFEAPFARDENGVEFSYEGVTYRFTPPSTRQKAGRKRTGGGALVAPMVGVVAEVLVAEGQAVEAYQTLVVIEAMKVMAKLDAPFAGNVSKVHVRKDQRVSHGELLVEVTPFKTTETAETAETTNGTQQP
jgi:biotin carboxyl carrier protein